MVLKIQDELFSWIDTLQKELNNCKGDPNRKVIIYSNENINGVLGLSKCLVEEFTGEENPIRYLI